MLIINPKMACLGRIVVARTVKHSRPNRKIPDLLVALTAVDFYESSH